MFSKHLELETLYKLMLNRNYLNLFNEAIPPSKMELKCLTYVDKHIQNLMVITLFNKS